MTEPLAAGFVLLFICIAAVIFYAKDILYLLQRRAEIAKERDVEIAEINKERDIEIAQYQK
jgi:hypothetical protein